MSAEAELQNACLLRYGREPGVTLWRQNTGVCKSEVCTRAHLERLLGDLSGAVQKSGTGAGLTYLEQAAKLVRGLLEERPRFTPFGLCKGSSDVVGIVERSCTVVMHGFSDPFTKPIKNGIFIAAEFKAPEPARIKITDEQAAFLRVVNERGGVGRVIRSEDDMGQLIEDARAL